MSDELDWELGDMFSSAIFPFPVYEQNSARRVVRYLLKRGVSDEDIATAIQGSTIDLHAWLNRHGKPMFGEWAIAWMNESRELYQNQPIRTKSLHQRNGSLNDSESFSREATPDDSCSSDDDDEEDYYFRSTKEADEESVASSGTSGFTGSTLDYEKDRDTRRLEVYRLDLLPVDSFVSVRSLDVAKNVENCFRPRPEVVSMDSGNLSDMCRSCSSSDPDHPPAPLERKNSSVDSSKYDLPSVSRDRREFPGNLVAGKKQESKGEKFSPKAAFHDKFKEIKIITSYLDCTKSCQISQCIKK